MIGMDERVQIVVTELKRRAAFFPWLAATVDAEGAIVADGPKRVVSSIRLRVDCTHPGMPMMCEEGTGFGSVKRTKHKDRLKPVYYWVITGKDAESVLQDCRPWLVVKAVEADIALEIYKLVGKPGIPVPFEVKFRKQLLGALLKECHARGKQIPQDAEVRQELANILAREL